MVKGSFKWLLIAFFSVSVAKADFVGGDGFLYVGPQHAQVPSIALIGTYQECIQWCWAAAAETLTASQGIFVDQTDLVQRVYPDLRCAAATIPQVVQALDAIYPTMDATAYVRLTAQGYSVVNPVLVRNLLQSGRVFLLSLTTHAVVCYGAHWFDKYDAWGNYYGPYIVQLDYQDPFYIWSPLTNPQYNYLDLNNPYQANSLGGMITIDAAPIYAAAISQQPVSQNVPYGSQFNLQVEVSGSPPFSFAWFKDGKRFGGNSNSLKISNATLKYSGTYNVVVQNAVRSVTSQAAIIQVVDASPAFTTQPKSVSKRAGKNALFVAKAKSRTPVSYQWLFNGTPIPGATTSSLKLTKVILSQAGEYRVQAGNSVGSTLSDTAVLTVFP